MVALILLSMWACGSPELPEPHYPRWGQEPEFQATPEKAVDAIRRIPGADGLTVEISKIFQDTPDEAIVQAVIGGSPMNVRLRRLQPKETEWTWVGGSLPGRAVELSPQEMLRSLSARKL